MHPYAGNPNNYPINVTLMDDGVDVPSFANFNTAFQGTLDRTAVLLQMVAGQLTTWQPNIEWEGGTGDTGPMAAIWNDAPIGTGESAQNWLIAAYHGTGFSVFYATGQDSIFTQLGGAALMNFGSSQQLYALAVDAAGNVYGSVAVPAAIGVFQMAPGGSAYTIFCAGTGTNVTDAEMVYVPGSNLVVAVGSSTAGAAYLGFAIASDYADVLPIAAVTIESWSLKAGGPSGAPYALAIGNAALAAPMVYKTTDGGAVWTSAAIGLGATDVPIDLSWNAAQQQWVLAVSVAGGGTTAFWLSPDGVTWTNTGVVLANAAFSSICALGPFFFAMRTISSPVTRFGEQNLCCSTDGKTWTSEGVYLPQVDDRPARVIASPKQLLGYNVLDISHYGNVRWSQNAGIADRPLT